MKLVHRFAYYLGGFGIGIILVIFFLSGKKSSCQYFPNSRVLAEIRSKHIEFSPEVTQFFEAHQIDTVVLRKFFYQGDVDFSASQTDRSKPCRVYAITGKHQDESILLKVKECKDPDSVAVISQAQLVTP